MDPQKYGEESAKPTDSNKALLSHVYSLKKDSEDTRTLLEARWARNLKVTKGIPVEGGSDYSSIRRTRKLYFWKTWATGQRLIASFHQAFLQDVETVKYEPREEEDAVKVKVLQAMVEYYRDFMMRNRSLFVKMLESFYDITYLGYAVGKFSWKYVEDEDGNVLYDEPDFQPWPLEQVALDWRNIYRENMQYAFFDSFLTKPELERMGYENIEDAKPCSIPSSELRSTRYSNDHDPIKDNQPDTTYPSPGSTGSDVTKEVVGTTLYKVTEGFYFKEGKMWLCVFNDDNCFLKAPTESKYKSEMGGYYLPIVLGKCLIEAHKLVGNGFPEPLEGPQESVNRTINARKDALDVAMRPRPIVSRYGNVDLQALQNWKAMTPIMVDEQEGLRFERTPEAGQGAYLEVNTDSSMMDEMSGVNPTKNGTSNIDKTGVAAINQAEANAKIDLFIATISETYIRDFYYIFAKLVSTFATDEKIFRVANAKLRSKGMLDPNAPDVVDLDVDADVITYVGAGTVGRQLQTNQDMTLLDRSIQYNNVVASLAKVGMIPPEGIEMVNIAALQKELFIRNGHKDVSAYFYKLPPPAPPEAQNPQDPSMQGDQGSGGNLPDMVQSVLGQVGQ